MHVVMNAKPIQWAQAVRHLEMGEHYLAARFATQGLRQDPDLGSLWQLRGIARYYLGDFRGSVEDFETSLCLCVLNPCSLWCMSASYVELGQYRSARDGLIALLRHKQRPNSLLYPTAGLFSRMGDNELALQSCEELARKEPSSAVAYYGQALFMSRMGYPPLTIRSRLWKACELSPDSIEYRVALGTVLSSSGDFQEAIDVLSSLRLDSVLSSHLASRIARAVESAGDRERASLWWARSLRLATMMI